MNEVESALRQLWPSVTDGALLELLPRDLDSLRGFYPRFQQFVDRARHGGSLRLGHERRSSPRQA